MKPRPTPTRILDDDATKAAKPIVLVLLGAYWPNHDATGPNQSFRAYGAALSDRIRVHGRGSRRAVGLQLAGCLSRAMDRWPTRKDAPLPDFPLLARGCATYCARRHMI